MCKVTSNLPKRPNYLSLFCTKKGRMSNLSVAADLVNVYPQLRISNNIEVDSRILTVPLRNVTEGRVNQHPSEFNRSAKRKIVTVSTFIFRHFSTKTLT
jgi:hypothetical protein